MFFERLPEQFDVEGHRAETDPMHTGALKISRFLRPSPSLHHGVVPVSPARVGIILTTFGIKTLYNFVTVRMMFRRLKAQGVVSVSLSSLQISADILHI